jgi:ribose-phosphate pyrophosphokinase
VFVSTGDVKGSTCVLVDDIIDVARILASGSDLLFNNGAKRVWIAGVHGVLATEDGINRLLNSKVEKVFISDSIDTSSVASRFGDRLNVLDSSELFGEAIRRIHFMERLEEYM